jgi:hypothetical protein
METPYEAMWPGLPGAVCLAAGSLLLVRGVLRRARERRSPPRSGNANALGLVRSLRLVLVGGGLAGTGVGLLADVDWLVALSLIIGGQELLETSIIAAALRDEERRRAMEAAGTV